MCNNAISPLVYGGQTYRTVQMPDGKIWMAENLNWAGNGGVYYNNNTLSKTGILYTWQQAITAAPSGWHLPTLDEWEALANAVGGSSTAGTKLKSKSGWNGKSNGTDNFSFSALPGGYCNSAFRNIGSNGYWWSASDNNIKNANFFYMNSSAAILRRSGTKSHFYSVRCVKD